MASLDEVQPTLEAGPSPGKVALRGRVYRTRCCCMNIPPPTDPAARQSFFLKCIFGTAAALFVGGSILYYAYPDDMEWCLLECPEGSLAGDVTRLG